MAVDTARVKSLFLAASDLADPAERAAYLDRECGGDAELRLRVEALLHADVEPQPVLDRPLAAVVPPEPVTVAEECGGTVLGGKYKLLERIGEGGMGSVWMAQQTEPVKRIVAVKLIKSGGDSKAVLARFAAERQALALMDHPNIAKVLDGGATDNGRPFFVMELVKGVPITKFCDARKLTPRQRLDLFVPVCQAIQHAHQKGIIHRDIKPSNVLIALYDDKPVPKVIDFGVAKATGGQLTEQTLQTGFGALVGTPQYMSPEQATLNNLDIDTRSDIYSLGVLLYELLAGSPPFRRKELEKAGMLEILRVIREEEPPKPSTKVSTADALPSLAANRGMEPVKLTRLLRGEIDWIVLKALDKERSRRYETANGFALDIQRYLADEPVLAGPPSAAYRLRKYVRRHKGQVTAAGLLLLALLLGMAGTTTGLVLAEGKRRDAVQAQQAETQRAEGERVAKENAEKAAKAEKEARELAEKRLKQIEKGMEILISVFHDLDPKAAEKEGESLRVLLGKHLGKAVQQLDGEAVGDPVVVARLQSWLGVALLGLGHREQAEVVLTKAQRTFEAVWGAEHPDALRAKNNLASLYDAQGKLPQAATLYQEMVEVETAKWGAEHPETLTTKGNLAKVYQHQGKYPQAEALYKEVLEHRAAKLGANHPDTLLTKSNLATLYKDQGKYPPAEVLYKEVLAGQTAKLGADHPDTLVTKNNLAMLYGHLGRFVQAETQLREVLAGQAAKLGADHPDTLVTKNNLATLYENQGKFVQAETLFQEMVEAKTVKLGADHLSTLTAKNSLAVVYQELGKYPQAETLLKEVLDSRTTKLGADHPHTLVTKTNLAVLYSKMKKLDRAIPLFEEVVEQRKKKLLAGHPDTLVALGNLGVTYRAVGRLDDAIRVLEEALAGMRNIPDPKPVKLAPIPLELALTYDQAKQFAKAEPLYREFLQQGRKQFGDGPLMAEIMAQFGLNLLAQKKYADAETVLRECLAVREKRQLDNWATFNTKSMLGEALLGQKKYADAEPLLKDGYDGMKKRQNKIPEVGRKQRLSEALQRLVQLYEATDNKDEAAKWKKEEEMLQKSDQTKP